MERHAGRADSNLHHNVKTDVTSIQLPTQRVSKGDSICKTRSFVKCSSHQALFQLPNQTALDGRRAWRVWEGFRVDH
jgi:hypothetical protein